MAYAMERRGIAAELEKRNGAFSLAFIAMFTITFVFLDGVGYVPDPSAHWKNEHGGQLISEGVSTGSSQTQAAELPIKIVADSIGLSASVGDPTSTDNAVLDQYLKSGAVRYPTSSELGVNGTVVLFGHSSYLPIVHNQAYKTFDGIQNLQAGDEISVYSSDHEYRYRVMNITKVAASDGTVALRSDGQYLTLVTCDSFDNRTQDRWIIESKLVGVYSLAS